jgi:phosphatidylserine decarboxylase
MTIHKEGYTIIIIAIIALVLLHFSLHHFFHGKKLLLISTVFISLVFLALVLNFFRNPKRNIPLNENHIVSPAMGTVVVIEEVEETEYFKDKRIQVSIFMSPLDVHINRNPIAGKVVYAKYHPGKYLLAWEPKSSLLNERNTIVLKNNKTEILVRQIAGFVARRIVCYEKEGETIQQGSELGFIKFGSRVDLFLPLGTKVEIKLNQKTIDGETIIAKI